MKYIINWSQSYTSWVTHAEKLLELRIELSGLKDAKKVIENIKKNL
jgi:mevalonate pyrophosphate decarboxylase